ncbi:MAG: histidinol-phosphatase, partial [Bacteroidota bacterium]
MKPILFIDRDGTIVSETDDEKVDKVEKLNFLPDALYYLRKIQAEGDFLLVMVTNQDGLGTTDFPDHEFWPVHDFIMRTLQSQGIRFDAMHIDEHWEKDNHPNRKPGIGMLTGYLNGTYDIQSSYVLGDRVTDVQLARNLGCKAIHIADEATTDAELTTESWQTIYDYLISSPRESKVVRETKETSITVALNLDG